MAGDCAVLSVDCGSHVSAESISVDSKVHASSLVALVGAGAKDNWNRFSLEACLVVKAAVSGLNLLS